MPPLVGRVAIVTGANHGIGAATAVELARLGADVCVTYFRFDDDDPQRPSQYRRHRLQDADGTTTAIAATGRRFLALEADLSDPSTPRQLFDAAEGALGPLDIVINNASGWRKDSFAQTKEAVSAETFDAQFLVDARGGALMISELARRHRHRRASWGRIVSLTSGGPMGFPGEVSYGAAKAALENYTMAASIELADLGITANVVYPPVTDTGWVTDDVRAFVARSTEHVHVAEPAEVATVVAWLCTDDARLVTGNVIRLR